MLTEWQKQCARHCVEEENREKKNKTFITLVPKATYLFQSVFAQ